MMRRRIASSRTARTSRNLSGASRRRQREDAPNDEQDEWARAAIVALARARANPIWGRSRRRRRAMWRNFEPIVEKSFRAPQFRAHAPRPFVLRGGGGGGGGCARRSHYAERKSEAALVLQRRAISGADNALAARGA